VRTKIIFILLIVSLNSFSYILPYFQQQRIYFKETIKSKSYNKVSFKIEDKEYTIDKSMKSSKDPLTYILSNLFTSHEKALNRFLKKHHINSIKKHYTLFNDIPTIVYGSDKKTNISEENGFISQIWLNNEKAYPVKAIFKLNNEVVIAEFNEFNNLKYKYMFPTKVTITVNGTKTVYQLTNFK